MQQNHTISAIATAMGAGGIGIIRLSGEKAIEIADSCFRPAAGGRLQDFPARKAVLGNIYDEKDKYLDEAIVIVMPAPHSYTCEDVVELQCHGGGLVLQQILLLTYRLGASPAEPGEFTKRAFLNGRLDLSQAQAVMDVIQAKTSASLDLASGNLQGRLSNKVYEMRQEILSIIAHLEASIDFPEDDIEDVSLTEAEAQVEKLHGEIEDLLAYADAGMILREGLQTAIIGRPNAGKSSLMNLMLGQERAIVTDVPGTTRDTIEEIVNIGGIPLKLVDTAGIRETDNVAEKIGVERAYANARNAKLILAVLDGTEALSDKDEETWQLLKDCQGKIIIIINKSDLPGCVTPEKIEQIAAEKAIGKIHKIISMSAKKGQGLSELEELIKNIVFAEKISCEDSILISDARQKNILQQSLDLLEQTRVTILNGMSEDFAVIDLRSAWEKLGEITGETIDEDIIDEIFSRFCIGK